MNTYHFSDTIGVYYFVIKACCSKQNCHCMAGRQKKNSICRFLKKVWQIGPKMSIFKIRSLKDDSTDRNKLDAVFVQSTFHRPNTFWPQQIYCCLLLDMLQGFCKHLRGCLEHVSTRKRYSLRRLQSAWCQTSHSILLSTCALRSLIMSMYFVRSPC